MGCKKSENLIKLKIDKIQMNYIIKDIKIMYDSKN
jgi:hypothetical protein